VVCHRSLTQVVANLQGGFDVSLLVANSSGQPVSGDAHFVHYTVFEWATIRKTGGVFVRADRVAIE